MIPYFYNALPHDIIERIRQHITASTDDENDGADSLYVTSKGKKIIIRVSNHCTHLWTWHERREGKFDDITRISIVFEDHDTYSDENLILKYPRRTPLRVMEYVYRIENTNEFSPQDVKMVIKSILRCKDKGIMFQDPTGKLTYFKERVSRNPDPDNKGFVKDSIIPRYNIIKEYNIQNNCNRNMRNKKVVRLTESQLHNIIAESVKRVINESDIENSPYRELLMDINKLRYKIDEFTDPFKIGREQDPELKEFLDNLYEANQYLLRAVNCDYISKLVTGKSRRERWDEESWEQN